MDNVERQKVAQEQVREQQLDRLHTVQNGSRTTPQAPAAQPAAPVGRKRVLVQPNVAVAQQTSAEAAIEKEASRIGERGHLDVDELVKYIQGNGSSKPSRGGKNSLRGKRRTGAKR